MTEKLVPTVSAKIPLWMPPMSKYVNSYALAANTAETVTWPDGYEFCKIQGTDNYWVSVGGTAAVPSTDITNGTASAMNVSERRRDGDTSFSVISTNAQTITVEFWTF